MFRTLVNRNVCFRLAGPATLKSFPRELNKPLCYNAGLCILIKLSHGGSEAPLNNAHIWGVGCVSYWVYLELMTVTIALCNSSSVQVL